jgi:hypothetical protein
MGAASEEISVAGKNGSSGRKSRFILTFTIVVVIVELLILIPLGLFVISSERTSFAMGLQRRVLVLLESITQGSLSYLPSNDIHQIDLVPQLAKAMNGAVYITVTGYAKGGTYPDVVWATNDPGISGKIDTATIQPGISQLSDQLSHELPSIIEDINGRSARDVAEIEATNRNDEQSISEKLSSIANGSVGTIPAFNPDDVDVLKGEYLFYKPILYRHGQDRLYYRGMVRLEVDAGPVLAEAHQAETNFMRIALIVAGIVLCLGIVGAFLLSAWFGTPPDTGV